MGSYCERVVFVNVKFSEEMSVVFNVVGWEVWKWGECDDLVDLIRLGMEVG